MLDFTGQELKVGDIVILPFSPSSRNSSLWLGVVSGFDGNFVKLEVYMTGEKPTILMRFGYDVIKTDMLDDITGLVFTANRRGNVKLMANLRLKGLI